MLGPPTHWSRQTWWQGTSSACPPSSDKETGAGGPQAQGKWEASSGHVGSTYPQTPGEMSPGLVGEERPELDMNLGLEEARRARERVWMGRCLASGEEVEEEEEEEGWAERRKAGVPRGHRFRQTR